MNNQTSHNLASLISSYQGFTRHEASLWKKTAMLVIKLKIKYTKRHLTTLELRRLIRRKTPTNDVMHFIKNLESRYHKARMMSVMMTQKLKNAIYVENFTRKQFNKCHDYMRRRWRHHSFLTSQFNIIMQHQITFTWDTERIRVMNKIEHLAHKYHRNHKPPDVIEDILISDEALEQKFGEMEKVPLPVFGGVQVNEAETAVLELGPKFCITPAVTMEQVQVATEKVMAQARWEFENRARWDGKKWSEAWQLEQTLARKIL